MIRIHLFEDRPPLGFRLAAIDTFVPRQYRASDHFAAQSGAIVVMQLENGVHLSLGVANVRFEEAGQPLEDY